MGLRGRDGRLAGNPGFAPAVTVLSPAPALSRAPAWTVRAMAVGRKSVGISVGNAGADSPLQPLSARAARSSQRQAVSGAS